jgi:hypothetical protein
VNDPVPGRAHTTEQKRAIIERLYAAWLRYPEQRLSQFISNATRGCDIFYIEDEAFLAELEQMAEEQALVRELTKEAEQ